MNKKNLANAQFASSVDDTTTTWELGSGQGSHMPDVPFHATATPKGLLSTLDNSEIVLVTDVTGDDLTVVRGQRGTTAKEFDEDDLVANGIYVEDLEAKLDKSGGTITGALDVDGDIYSNGEKVFAGTALCGLTKRTSDFDSTSARAAVPGHSLTVTVPEGKKLRLTFTGTALTGSTSTKQAEIHLGSVSGTTNRIAIHNDLSGSATTQLGFSLVHYEEVSPGTYTYVAAINSATLVAGAAYPSIFSAELV